MQVKDHANQCRRATQRTTDKQSYFPALALTQSDLILGLESMKAQPIPTLHHPPTSSARCPEGLHLDTHKTLYLTDIPDPWEDG